MQTWLTSWPKGSSSWRATSFITANDHTAMTEIRTAKRVLLTISGQNKESVSGARVGCVCVSLSEAFLERELWWGVARRVTADEEGREDGVHRQHEQHSLGVRVREWCVDDLLALLEGVSTRHECTVHSSSEYRRVNAHCDRNQTNQTNYLGSEFVVDGAGGGGEGGGTEKLTATGRAPTDDGADDPALCELHASAVECLAVLQGLTLVEVKSLDDTKRVLCRSA